VAVCTQAFVAPPPSLLADWVYCTDGSQCQSGYCAYASQSFTNVCQENPMTQAANNSNTSAIPPVNATGLVYGSICIQNSDCSSGSCDFSITAANTKVCQAAGSPPGPAANLTNYGGHCQNNSDCISNICAPLSNSPTLICQAVGYVAPITAVAVGGKCASETDCASGACVNSICIVYKNGQNCANNTECQSGICDWAYTTSSFLTCLASLNGKAPSSPCLSNSDCSIGQCKVSQGRCQQLLSGWTCVNDSDCVSNSCPSNPNFSYKICK